MFNYTYVIKSDRNNFFKRLVDLEYRDTEEVIGDISLSSRPRLVCSITGRSVRMSFNRPVTYFSMKRNLSDFVLVFEIDEGVSKIYGTIKLKLFVLLSLIFITGVFVSFLLIDVTIADYLFLLFYLLVITVYFIRQYHLFKKEMTKLFVSLDDKVSVVE